MVDGTCYDARLLTKPFIEKKISHLNEYFVVLIQDAKLFEYSMRMRYILISQMLSHI